MWDLIMVVYADLRTRLRSASTIPERNDLWCRLEVLYGLFDEDTLDEMDLELGG